MPTTLPTCRILLGSWDAIWHDTIFKMWNRRNRLCILGTGLIDAFVNVSNKHGPYQNNELCFRELMHGRIKMMTRVCSAWSRTHQSLSLGWRPELLGPSRLRLLKPKAKFRQLSASQPPRALLADRGGWCIFTVSGSCASCGNVMQSPQNVRRSLREHVPAQKRDDDRRRPRCVRYHNCRSSRRRTE